MIPPINHVDHTVFGALPLELYIQTEQAKYRVLRYIDENAAVREVCVGTGTKNDLQYYLDRPRSVGDLHGPAPVLWAASVLLR